MFNVYKKKINNINYTTIFTKCLLLNFYEKYTNVWQSYYEFLTIVILQKIWFELIRVIRYNFVKYFEWLDQSNSEGVCERRLSKRFRANGAKFTITRNMQLPSEWISTRFVLYFPFSTTPFPSYPFSHRVCLPTSLDSKMYQALHLPSSLVEGSNWNSWTQLLSLFPYFLPPLSSSHSLPPTPSLSLSPSLFCSYFLHWRWRQLHLT